MFLWRTSERLTDSRRKRFFPLVGVRWRRGGSRSLRRVGREVTPAQLSATHPLGWWCRVNTSVFAVAATRSGDVCEVVLVHALDDITAADPDTNSVL